MTWELGRTSGTGRWSVDEMNMKHLPLKHMALRAMEFGLGISLSLILVASILATFIKDQVALQHWLEEQRRVLSTIGIAECCLLLLWMVTGGQKSIIWDWLPPFCFFGKSLWIRWFAVIALLAGTLLGVWAMRAG